jgi:GNAT superfamily N-acetyltransferase
MHKQEPAISIERLDQTNITNLPVLYHAVYGRENDTAFFTKKYKTVYAGVEYLGYIAYSKDRKPVAFLGAIPCELYYDEKIIAAAQLTDGMTDPAYRKHGVFVQLVEKITELCKQNSVRFIFGFPNQHSLPVFLNRLEWSIYGKMHFFNLPVKGIPLEKIAKKFSLFAYLYKRHVYSALKKYNTIPAISISSTDPGIYKSDTYVNYKYTDSVSISIGHSCARIKIKNGMRIGDISVTENEFANVMQVIQKMARELGVADISFHCSTGGEVHRLFAGRYEPTSSFTIISKDLGAGIPLDALKFTYGDIDIF